MRAQQSDVRLWARRGTPGILASLLALALTSSSAPAQGVATPRVAGPVAARETPGSATHDYVFHATPMDLQRARYVEQEYFIDGIATRYVIPNGPGDLTSPGTMPYRTRVVVRRPVSQSDFRGVAVVEWLNAVGGQDLDAEWAQAGDFFVRAGWAWVGASVQQAGVHGSDPPSPVAGQGLKQWSPERYGSLDLRHAGAVTDDSAAFDIYSQVGRLLKDPQAVDPLGGLRVQRVYASGNSAAARLLLRYYNFIQPTTGVFDGFFLSMGGESPRLDQPTKLLKMYTESDVPRQAPLRVSNSDSIHTWEIAGAPHMPSAWQSPDRNDFRGVTGMGARDSGFPELKPDCARPYPSTVETWLVQAAAYAALDRWVTTNVRPAITAPIETAPTPGSPVHTVVRDSRGIGTGGIRLPAIAVPTALNSGENRGANAQPQNGVCGLLGAHVPFDASTLASLYATREAYAKAVQQVVEDLVRQGVVLKEGGESLIDRARRAFPQSRESSP